MLKTPACYAIGNKAYAKRKEMKERSKFKSLKQINSKFKSEKSKILCLGISDWLHRLNNNFSCYIFFECYGRKRRKGRKCRKVSCICLTTAITAFRKLLSQFRFSPRSQRCVLRASLWFKKAKVIRLNNPMQSKI